MGHIKKGLNTETKQTHQVGSYFGMGKGHQVGKPVKQLAELEI